MMASCQTQGGPTHRRRQGAAVRLSAAAGGDQACAASVCRCAQAGVTEVLRTSFTQQDCTRKSLLMKRVSPCGVALVVADLHAYRLPAVIRAGIVILTTTAYLPVLLLDFHGCLMLRLSQHGCSSSAVVAGVLCVPGQDACGWPSKPVKISTCGHFMR